MNSRKQQDLVLLHGKETDHFDLKLVDRSTFFLLSISVNAAMMETTIPKYAKLRQRTQPRPTSLS